MRCARPTVASPTAALASRLRGGHFFGGAIYPLKMVDLPIENGDL